MILKDEVIEMARDWSYSFGDNTASLTNESLYDLVQLGYKRGIEDALAKAVELGVVSKDGRFSDELRKLRETE